MKLSGYKVTRDEDNNMEYPYSVDDYNAKGKQIRGSHIGVFPTEPRGLAVAHALNFTRQAMKQADELNKHLASAHYQVATILSPDD